MGRKNPPKRHPSTAGAELVFSVQGRDSRLVAVENALTRITQAASLEIALGVNEAKLSEFDTTATELAGVKGMKLKVPLRKIVIVSVQESLPVIQREARSRKDIDAEATLYDRCVRLRRDNQYVGSVMGEIKSRVEDRWQRMFETPGNRRPRFVTADCEGLNLRTVPFGRDTKGTLVSTNVSLPFGQGAYYRGERVDSAIRQVVLGERGTIPSSSTELPLAIFGMCYAATKELLPEFVDALPDTLDFSAPIFTEVAITQS